MSFASQVMVFLEKADKETTLQFRKRTFQLYVDVVDGTPRDTGTLRANWQFGTALNGEKNTKPDGEKFSSAEETTAISTARSKNRELNLDDTALIFNNMEYAEAVEKGLGPGERTPRRMVAKAIALMEGKGSIK